ncbi:hypothetical protein GCM10027290_65050 [Micromonospora sonneratiae]|uniref:Uncharacterized protein n=1 Tax=Micromonospora sonneratiae TaxID=1184706 RepID=A0ABW3YLT1_9ACTN
MKPSPRQRRLYDEIERRSRPLLDDRTFEKTLDELIRWASGSLPLREHPAAVRRVVRLPIVDDDRPDQRRSS